MSADPPGIDRLSADERATWEAVKRLSGAALSTVGGHIEAATGFSAADFAILTRLEDLGGGSLAQAALLMSLAWEKSRLSHQLTRMAARGLIERERSDGRGVLVHLSASGRDRIAAARPVHAEAVRTNVLRHIAPDEARALAAIVDRLADDRLADGPARPPDAARVSGRTPRADTAG